MQFSGLNWKRVIYPVKVKSLKVRSLKVSVFLSLRCCCSETVSVFQRALHASMPFTVFCLSGLSAGCLGLLLPETLNRPAADTLEELSGPSGSRVLENKVMLQIQNPSNRHQIKHPDFYLQCLVSLCRLCCTKRRNWNQTTSEALVFVSVQRERPLQSGVPSL